MAYLAQIHDNCLVNLLPQVSPEDLNQRDLQRGDLAVHEDAGQVQLDLETNVDVRPVDGRRPPKREATVGNLVQPGALGIRQLFVLHRLLEAGSLLPEQAFPRREVGALEQRVLQDALDTAKRLDHVRAVVVEIPQLAVVALMRPPKRILLQHLVGLALRPRTPALVVGKRVPVLLEQRVDPRNAPVPRILQVLQRQPPVLGIRLLPLQRVLCPDALRVDEIGLPRLDVPVQIGNDLVFVVAHARAEMRDADVGLLRPPQVALRNQHVAHGKHSQATQFLRRVEDDRREPRRHLEVEADLDARLDLVLALDEQVEQFLRVDDRLPEVRHQPDERRVPLVDDLGESGGTGG